MYRIPLFQILEQRGFEVCLVNARHVKNVPGRRTDVSDCPWYAQEPEPLAKPKFTDGIRRAELKRVWGVDLTKIPGIRTGVAQKLFGEIGPDFTKFRSASAFASWMGLCPDNHVNGGKVLFVGTRKVKCRAALALRMAAQSIPWRPSECLSVAPRSMPAASGLITGITGRCAYPLGFALRAVSLLAVNPRRPESRKTGTLLKGIAGCRKRLPTSPLSRARELGIRLATGLGSSMARPTSAAASAHETIIAPPVPFLAMTRATGSPGLARRRIIARAFAHPAQFRAAVAEASLPLHVQSVEHTLGTDWNGEAAVFFDVVLNDSSAPRQELLAITKAITHAITQQVEPLEAWGVLPYFNFVDGERTCRYERADFGST